MQPPKFSVIRIMDTLDDLMGIVSAASSSAYLLIIFLTVVLGISATLTQGLRGLVASLLIGGVAVAAATLSASRD